MVSHCACPTRAFRCRALHEHRRPSSLPSHPLLRAGVPGAQDLRGCPSHPFFVQLIFGIYSLSKRGGQVTPQTARIVLTRPSTGTPRRAMSPGDGLPIFFTSRQGSGRGCPLLRASNEHSFTVRVLRARRAPGRSLSILLRPRVARARETPTRAACSISTRSSQGCT